LKLKDTTPGALHEVFFVYGTGAVNACWKLESPLSAATSGSQGPVIPQPVGGDRWF